MKKILLFDIDKTLFNPTKYLELLFESLSKDFKFSETSEGFKEIYERTKKEQGYFKPEAYFDEIVKICPQIPRDQLEKAFWNDELFGQSLYSDAISIKKLFDRAILGIFSKGDHKFQLKKLNFIIDSLDKENIYIYTNKIEHVAEIISNLQDSEIYFVDNDQKVINSIQDVSNKPHLILIDRLGNLEDNQGITKISSLTELQNIL